jgi:3-deoxy-manno-octulosonate cytidylyltransferase (CMP-KDO synthetase)
MSRVLGVIPARYASTRLPGKPLAPLADRTLLEHVWRRTVRARLDRVVVATDDRRILEAARGFGAEALLTSAAHPSGTDRVAEVAERVGADYRVVVNVQGDEPLLAPESLDRLVALFEDPAVGMATLCEPLETAAELADPNVVKVVRAQDGRALYFSRAPIPHPRAGAPLTGALAGGVWRKHQGIYAYTRDTLLALARTPVSPLEAAEGLEQLRALELGCPILVLDSDFHSIGVDTPADLERAAEHWSKGVGTR